MTRKLRTVPLLALLFLVCFGSIALAGTLIDPTVNPGGFLDQMIGFAHTNVWLAVGLAVFGLAELGSWAGREFPWKWLAWLGKGRATVIVAGVIAVLGAALQAYIGDGNLQGAFVAAFVALSAYWHGKAGAVLGVPDPAPAKTPGGGFIRRGLIFGLAVAVLGGALVIACGAQQKKALADLGHCTESTAWNDLKPTVQAILESGVKNWKQQLEALGVTFGKDEILCAVASAEEAFSKMGAGSADASTAAAKARAAEFLNEHGVKAGG